jgi:arabinosaccharide transport system substrate-binding protein
MASSLYVALRPAPRHDGRVLWTFIRHRVPVYEAAIRNWDLSGKDAVRIELIELQALSRRLQSGFFSGTPLADLVEVERSTASATWRGPLEAVGFVDLTERLHAEGLYQRINTPSFSPWTNRGRIFGLPSDVHPVLLCYRADIFEAAGIDVTQLDTWDKFFAATAHLVADLSGNGRPDRYVFELAETTNEIAIVLILQAGGRLFDDDGRPVLDNPVNVRVLAQLASWASGPNKLTADLELHSGAGNQLRASGYVLSWLVPDWRAKLNQLYLGELAGKLKLMPVPAWEEGGRRTSSWGGTMLGLTTTSPTIEANWEFAKRLYLSHELAISAWRDFGVLTPVKDFWSDPVFDQPNPYFSGQAVGRLFVNQAPHVPNRTSSPYFGTASAAVGTALNALIRLAEARGGAPAAALEPQAREVLAAAQTVVLAQMARNLFDAVDLPISTP